MSDVVVNEHRRRIWWKVSGTLSLIVLLVNVPFLASMIGQDSIVKIARFLLMTLAPFLLLPHVLLFIRLRHSPKRVVFGPESVDFRFSTRSLSLRWEEIGAMSGSHPLYIHSKSGDTVTLRFVDPEIVKAIFSRVLRTREAGFWRGVSGL